MQPQIWFHFISILIVMATFLYFKYKYGIAGQQPPIDNKEWKWLYDKIQGAATRSELAALEAMSDEWEEKYRAHAHCREMYTELLDQIQARYIVLGTKKLQNS